MKKFGLIFFFIGFYGTAQKVSNITTRQDQSTIIVSYDLETKLPCKVSLYISTNGGKTWQGPLTKVKGDVGDKIISGNKIIYWNVLEEFDALKGENIKFQVKAISNVIYNIPTVKIGNQEWTTKNLNVSTYRNGDVIPEVTDPKVWANLTTGAWCYYDNDPKNGEIYGKLYNWYAVNDTRGLAPEGYHIPSDSEFSTIIEYLEGGQQHWNNSFEKTAKVAGGKMKEISTNHWKWPNSASSASNSSGFNGLPGGECGYSGHFGAIGAHGYWWSSSESGTWSALYLNLYYNGEYTYSFFKTKYYGLSVRCLKD